MPIATSLATSTTPVSAILAVLASAIPVSATITMPVYATLIVPASAIPVSATAIALVSAILTAPILMSPVEFSLILPHLFHVSSLLLDHGFSN